MVQILGPLSARPPTPPKTASRIVIDENNQQNSPIVIQTPADSRFQVPGSAGAPPSSLSSKRVNFSPWTKYIKPPAFADTSSTSVSDLKALPPSNECKPAKSILKATQAPIPVWSPNVDTFTAESLAMLLESVIQQLAGESISSRLDAYMQFFGALRTYEGLPAGHEVADKLSLITAFIQRDVSRDLVNGGPLDTNLANQALKLSATFVWHPEISSHLSDEFKIFLVEHAITCLQEAKVPKSVLNHYMSILATQYFGPKIMTATRITRLLAVLQHINKRVTGNAVVSYRLSIYQRLLGQAKSTFAAQSALWIENLVFGLLHDLKDTRSKALSLGFQTAIDVGVSPVLSKSVRDLFDRPLENNRKLVTEIHERMCRMIRPADTGVHVPQIWSIIVLLLRRKRWSLDYWEHFKEWVLVLQKCFNCSEPAIKAQAIVGWNKFVYAVGPNESTSRSLLKMLGKPVLSQFERNKSDKLGSPPTQLALTSYCNLLYYAFRPSVSYQHLDVVWEEYVAAPASNILSSTPALSDCTSLVLRNLLWSSQVWAENRINDNDKLQPEDLPSVDSKWVRSRISSVLGVFEHLFKSSIWDNDAVRRSNVALAWINLSNALSFASSKEITPSVELMQAVANVLGLLHRLWAAGPTSLNTPGGEFSDTFFERFRFLSTSIIPSLVSIPFTEKLLLKTADETFQTSNTPTHRHSPPRSDLTNPTIHLLQTVSSTPRITTPTLSYTRLVVGIIESSCHGKISRGSRLELLQQCADLSVAETAPSSQVRHLSEVVWKSTAQATADALRSFPIESARERDGSVSRDYENVIKILSSGLGFTGAFQDWSHLLDSFVRVVRTEKGDRVLATMIIEPMAERLMRLPPQDTYMPSTSLFGHSLSIPFLQDTTVDRQDGNAQAAGPLLFPHQLLDSVERTLQEAYEGFDTLETCGLADFIESLTSFLGSGVSLFRSQVLQTLQSPLGLWLKDESSQIDVDRGVDSRILTAVSSYIRRVPANADHVNSVAHCRPLSSTFCKHQCLMTWLPRRDSNQFSAPASNHHTCRELRDSSSSGVRPLVRKNHSPILKPLRRRCGKRSPSLKLRLCTRRLILRYFDMLILPLQNERADHLSAQASAMLSSGPHNTNDQPRNEAHACGGLIKPPPGGELNSSPVFKARDSSILEPTAQPAQTQLPVVEAQISDEVSVNDSRKKHRDIFSMIESIQSSSPAPNPGRLGFRTPPHLCSLRHSESAPDIPLTPTFAAAENEEGFLGSSPTPGTRDPTPAAGSDVPALASQDVEMQMDSDIPSSPPELHSQSPSHHKRSRRSRSARRRAARPRKSLSRNSEGDNAIESPSAPANVTEDTSEIHRADALNAPAQEEGVPQSIRLGAASTKTTPTESKPPTLAPAVQTPETAQVDHQSAQITTSNSNTKKRKHEKSQSRENRQPRAEPANATVAPTKTVPDYVVDSSSEDVETQITSQLVQDLELAVDMTDKTEIAPSSGQVQPESAARKRKRGEAEAHQAPTTERRRSRRLSTREEAPTDSQEPVALQLQNLNAPNLIQDASFIEPPSAAPRRTTRSSQRKDEVAVTESVPSTQYTDLTQESGNPENSQPRSKRQRKSLRLEGHTASPIAEDSPSRGKSRSRSRKGLSRQSQSEPQTQPSQDADLQPEKSTGQDELPQAQNDVQEVVPDSIVSQEKPGEPKAPPLPTDEAVDTQMSDLGVSTEPDSVRADIQMEMGTDMVAETQPDNKVTEQVPSMATAATQTETKSPPDTEANSSETGIARSLKKLLDNMKLATLSPNSLREVDDLLFNIRVEAHDASKRHNNSA